MSWIITITAFSVIIPFTVGMWFYNRMPTWMQPVVWILGMWTAAEVYCYVLRVQGISNAHVSYITTAAEVLLFCHFYARTIERKRKDIMKFAILSFLVIVDWLFANQFSTISLTLEYAMITVLAIYLHYDIITERRDTGPYLTNLLILFYMLSSFPYFFAYEWLRISNLSLLMFLAGVYAYVHAACYLVLTYAIWKQSSSSSVRSSFR